ncbi:MAG: hypothetical protein J6U14_05140 [Bacteroidaceae bacterium]|nr:hypothetical protein [Bacteroidaceae bacterium]
MIRKYISLLFVTLMTMPSAAQEISGVVMKNGKPKKGITVWLKKADKLAETDKDGHFFFNDAFSGDTLQITATAKTDAKIILTDWKEITINLEKKNFTFNGGKGETTGEYITLPTMKPGEGVTHEMIMRSGLRTIPDIIRNYISGVVVLTDGGSTKVQVHGISSVNSGTDPLVVLDGIALQGADLDTLVPVETIASLKVIKDGAGYGVRGANGVIEIETIK